MSGELRTAIILAAGMGSRLREIWSDLPKGFVEIGAETLIDRCIRLLRERGVERIVIVAGYQAHAYHELALRGGAGAKGLEILENEAFADTGSMASLAIALERVDEDFLLLESDLFFEARALDALLEAHAPDVLLASGPTRATDEVWVETDSGRLTGMSKDAKDLASVDGELVGLLRVSSEFGRLMLRGYRDFVARHGHGRMGYDTDAIPEAAKARPMHVHVIPDLLWGEVDYEFHYHRVRDEVWPRCRAKEEGRPAAEEQSKTGRPVAEERANEEGEAPVTDTPRKVLLNPGPATTTQSVKDAMVMTDVCPREKSFCDLYRDVRRRLAQLAGDIEEIAAIPLVGSGTTALEAALVSLVPADGRVIIIDNGDYGTRLCDMAHALGIDHRAVEFGWGKPIDLAALEAVLEQERGRATDLVFVHHETSSGLLNPLGEVTALARKFDLSVMLDAVSSFACLPIRVGAGGVDTLISSSNKCVQGMAGLGFVITTRLLLDRLRVERPRAFVLNLVAEFDHLEKTGQSRFTVPPQVVAALHQALIELEQEGLEERGKRYTKSMETLVAGLAELGFERLLEDSQQSRILVALREPREDWYDFAEMHAAMDRAGFTIYPGKPGADPTFRLAVLGAIDASDIDRFLQALRSYLEQVRT